MMSGCEKPHEETVSKSTIDVDKQAKASEQLEAESATPQQQTCSNRNPLRNAYFGDLHVHTGLSIDAFQQDVRTMPKDAYAFAKGEEIDFHDSRVQIDRPLDFVAVTDHAEYLGEMERCTSPNDPQYHSAACDKVRRGSGAAFQILEKAFAEENEGTRAERVTRALKVLFISEDPKRNSELCGEQGELCAQGTISGWQKIINAAEEAQDRSSDCSFTSFIGYEYSGVKTGSNYHRNVIFRNHLVPALPVSYLDAPRDYMLWGKLEQSCTKDVPGCEYLAIPHNPNLSNGKLLTPDFSSADNLEEEKALAFQRQQAEPLMEIFQHKGQSECINGGSTFSSEFDPLCEIEQVRNIGDTTTVLEAELVTEECMGEFGNGGMIDTGCVSRNDYLRGALLTGMEEEQRLGVNPLKLGVIASTDTHESTPGAVDEQTWPGHVGRERELNLRLQQKSGLPYRLDGAPGGLAGVWATENSRDALFDAMKKRETFGTSGPRIKPRFFAGWSYDKNLCEYKDFVEQAYGGGVPMGADLNNPPNEKAKPQFAAAAIRDPEGNLLQVLQLIKGWIDKDSNAHVKVINIAGNAEQLASVDLNTGQAQGEGFTQLCVVYEDETFDIDEPAYYYLRVVENPSLRWSWAQCIALKEEQQPAACTNNAPKTIQEMAWTSPIWYSPR